MSRVTSDRVTFFCDGHGYMQSRKCDGHVLTVKACLSSDTVSVDVDGEPEFVMSDRGFAALEKAIESLNNKWKRSDR